MANSENAVFLGDSNNKFANLDLKENNSVSLNETFNRG